MKRYVLFVTAACMTAAAALASLSVRAQDDGSPDVKQKAPKEIIIKKLSPDAKGKTVIVIDGDKVTINGKPAGDWGKEKGDWGTQESLDLMKDKLRFKVLEAQDALNPNAKVRLGVYSKENEKGAEITRVMDSSAAFKAGLKEGDIIVKVDDSPISDPEALAKAVKRHEPNEQVTVKYIRDGKEKGVVVTLEKPKVKRFESLVWDPGQWNPGEFKGLGDGIQGFMLNHPRLGAHIQDMDDSSGVKVLQIDPESPAARAGLQKDDVITSIAGQKVTGTDQALDALRDAGDKHEYPVTVNRAGAALTLEVKIPHELRSATL